MSRRSWLLLLVAGGAVAWLGFFFFRDNFSTHYPLKVLSARAFRAGEIPWWNFHSGGGQPLAGNPNALTFYPDNVLYLFLPAHVAFNLHFLLHLAGGFFAMRALTRSTFGGALWALSGIALSATSFYNLVTAVALIPLAFLAVERGRVWMLGAAFGLLALAGEPVTLLATALAVGILALTRSALRSAGVATGETSPRSAGIPAGRSAGILAGVAVLALLIASPQLVAYSEIATEVERAHGFSSRTVLNASLHPSRLIEVVLPITAGKDAGGPAGKDAGTPRGAPRLFLTLFLGIIVIPALAQRSRYVVVAATMLFFALGAYNPLVRAAVEALPAIRIARFPEKFALPMTAALVVLAATYFERSTNKRVWLAVTFVPLAIAFVMRLPIDWFAPYDVASKTSYTRVYRRAAPGGQTPSREEYRARAARDEPLFGAVAGWAFALNRSPDGMHSLLSRIAAERAPTNARYLRIAGCGRGALPQAMLMRNVIGVQSVNEAVQLIEGPAFDERAAAIVPAKYASLRPTTGEVTYSEKGQTIDITVRAPGEALLFVNQSWFNAWVARAGDRELQTLPIHLDRLGVVVPPGVTHVTLTFGRRRALVTLAWIVSSLLLVAIALIEKRDRGAGEVERPGDEHAPLR